MCGLVSGVIMALGIYTTRKRSDESDPRPTRDNTCLPKVLRLGFSNIAAHIQQEIIPKFEKKPLVQYETAV